MSLIVTPKFQYHRNSRSLANFGNTTSAWSNTHSYRTNYRDMSIKSPAERKSYIIPGYGGHIPKVNGHNRFGKTMTQISRECFKKDALGDQNPDFYMTQGSGWQRQIRLDRTLHGINHKYGKQTIPLFHPETNQNWQTTSSASWNNPRIHAPPHLRIRSINIDEHYANDVGSPDVASSSRPFSKQSGFVQNSTLFDGTTWEPDRHLYADLLRTEYRNRFNKDKPFHKEMLKGSQALLRPKVKTYDNDDQGDKVPKQFKLLLTSPQMIKKAYCHKK